MPAVTAFAALTRNIDGLSETEIPLPPQWVTASVLYPLFWIELAAFLKARGIRSYKVTSGYRAPSDNERVGGAAHSAHMYGTAADIVFDDIELRNLGLTRSKLASEWISKNGGWASSDYPSHVHFNASRKWAWHVLKWFVVLILLAVVLIFIFMRG